MRNRLFACLMMLLPVALQPATSHAQTADGESLRLGVFPRHSAADTQRMFEPLRAYLSARLGMPVVLETPVDFASFWSAIEQRRFDLVHYNQYHYIRAHADFGHRLLVANEERGRSQIRAHIHVRFDSPVQEVHELKGRKILFGGGPSAMVSYILAIDLLRQHDLNDGDYIEGFAQNPGKALVALHFLQADAAAAGDPVVDLPAVREAIGDGSLRILAQSKPIPHLAWAATSRVNDAIARAVKAALLDLNTAGQPREILKSLQVSGLRSVDDRQYDIVRKIVERVRGERY